MGLTAFGVMFAILGMIMFFDRGLIAMGNVSVAIAVHGAPARRVMATFVCMQNADLDTPPMQLLFLAGLATTIGFRSAVQFFARRKNRKVGLVTGRLPHDVLLRPSCLLLSF